jgi:ribosomal protein S18 acetylase RimI-like enzyme
MAYLKRAGFRSVSLKVRADNRAAQGLYRSCGFHIVAESSDEIELMRRVAEPACTPPQPFGPFAMAKGTLGPVM